MESQPWPPQDGEYFPRRIFERLEALNDLTEVRSTGWTDNVAEVTVWPYSEEIAQAVRECLAPLAAAVEAQESLPRRY